MQKTDQSLVHCMHNIERQNMESDQLTLFSRKMAYANRVRSWLS